MFRSKYSLAIIITSGTVLLDITTKFLIHKYISFGAFIEIIPGFFNLNHVHNPGAAFGMLSSLEPHVRQIFFAIVTFLAALIFGLQLRNCLNPRSLHYVAYSLIIGGAIGNASNRIYLGHVVDFLDFHWRDIYHYPSFNFADIAICTAGGLLVYQQIRKRVH